MLTVPDDERFVYPWERHYPRENHEVLRLLRVSPNPHTYDGWQGFHHN